MRRVIVESYCEPFRNTMNHDSDWQATLTDYEAGDPIGHGPTEACAVMDLYENIAFVEDCQADAALEKNG